MNNNDPNPKSSLIIRNGHKILITEGELVVDELTGEIVQVESILGEARPGFLVRSTVQGGLRHATEIGPLDPNDPRKLVNE